MWPLIRRRWWRIKKGVNRLEWAEWREFKESIALAVIKIMRTVFANDSFPRIPRDSSMRIVLTCVVDPPLGGWICWKQPVIWRIFVSSYNHLKTWNAKGEHETDERKDFLKSYWRDFHFTFKFFCLSRRWSSSETCPIGPVSVLRKHNRKTCDGGVPQLDPAKPKKQSRILAYSAENLTDREPCKDTVPFRP